MNFFLDLNKMGLTLNGIKEKIQKHLLETSYL